jgi:hypothetical protein
MKATVLCAKLFNGFLEEFVITIFRLTQVGERLVILRTKQHYWSNNILNVLKVK